MNAYAVIIGIGDYRDTSIPSLKYTINDANELYEVLNNPLKVGIPENNIRILLNDEATLQNIKSTVGTWLLHETDEDSTVIIFFSGHGGVEAGVSGDTAKYLLPWDARRDDLYATAISSRDFEGLLQRIRSNRLVMFLDACHSGGVIAREGTKGARDVMVVDNICTDLAAGSGRAIIAASQGNQQSYEDDDYNHGIFAYHLLEALNGKADSNDNGEITLTETFNYLGREVPRSARRLAGATQEPMMRSDLTKDIVLAVDHEKLERSRTRKEQEQKARKAEDDMNRLFRFWNEEQLDTETYDRALEIYGADYQALDKNGRQLKKLTHDLLDGKISIRNYAFSSAKLTGMEKEKSPDEEPSQEIEKDKIDREKPDHADTVDEDYPAEDVDEETTAARETAVKKAREIWEESERKRKAEEEEKARIESVPAVGISRPDFVPVDHPSESRPAEGMKPQAKADDRRGFRRLIRSWKTWLIAVVFIGAAVAIPVIIIATHKYDVNVKIEGDGTVETSRIDNRVTLTASPAYGSYFSTWKLGEIGDNSNPLELDLKKDMDITASFKEINCSLTLNIQGSGDVEKIPDKTSYKTGESVELTAVASSGWIFSHWEGDVDNEYVYAREIGVSMESSLSLTAVFSKPDRLYMWYPVSTHTFPYFEDDRMSLAVCLALDESTISRLASNYFNYDIQLISPNDLTDCGYDLEKAKQYYDESGYPDGLHMRMFVLEGDEVLLYLANKVKEYLAKIDIIVEINVSTQQWWEDVLVLDRRDDM